MATESPANGVSTTLSAAITSTATALSLTSATGFPNGQYTCLLSDGTNAELVEASALSGTTLTVARASEAWGGSATAYAFGIGTKVTIVTSVQSVIRLIQSYAAPATTVTGPDAFGAAAVVGVGTTFARADHDHGLPAAPSPTLTTYSGAISTAVSLPTSTWTTVLTTVSLPLGTYLLSVVIEVMPAATATAVTSLAGFIGGGTGVATFQYAGINSNISNGQPTNTYSLLSATQVITVTTAGTFVIQVNPNATAADAEQCYYAAVKIA